MMDSGMGQEQQAKREALLMSLSELVGSLVEDNQDNAIALVELLRVLERLHRGITEGAFQQALPQNRQELYKLMRVIEEEGGWPHIPKMRLQMLYAHLIDSQEPEAGK
jgi:hypothetical protein